MTLNVPPLIPHGSLSIRPHMGWNPSSGNNQILRSSYQRLFIGYREYNYVLTTPYTILICPKTGSTETDVQPGIVEKVQGTRFELADRYGLAPQASVVGHA